MSDSELIGKVGIVTTPFAAGGTGEISLTLAGGSQAFYAYSESQGIEFKRGDRVQVVDHIPPRSVYVIAPRV